MPTGRLYLQEQEYDPNVDASESYDADTDYVKWKGENQEIQFMVVTGDPGANTNHDAAPNGSLCVDITNFVLYIKTAASTWTIVGTQS